MSCSAPGGKGGGGVSVLEGTLNPSTPKPQASLHRPGVPDELALRANHHGILLASSPGSGMHCALFPRLLTKRL